MKHQYFGDRRDLFMFDLVGEVLTRTDLRGLYYIPMLTRDDDPDYELKTDMSTARAGRDNTELREYLVRCYDDGKRSIYETEGVFGLPSYSDLKFDMHRLLFQDQVRMQYFLAIPKEALEGSIVLLDPDEGLQVRGSGKKGENYLRYDEVRYLYELMDPRSVLMVFQHLPDKGRYGAIMEVVQHLQEWVTHGRPVLSISDRRETFLLLIADNYRQREVEDILPAYEERYGLRLEDD